MKNNNDKKCTTVMGAAVIGAAVGAAAVAFLHEPTREKVRGALTGAIEKGGQKLDEVSNKAKDVKESAKKKAVKELGKAQKKLAEN